MTTLLCSTMLFVLQKEKKINYASTMPPFLSIQLFLLIVRLCEDKQKIESDDLERCPWTSKLWFDTFD